MAKLSQYEIEREANIARNRALLEQLELNQAVASLPAKAAKATSKAKPVQPSQKRKKPEPEAPRRQSARLRRGVVDPSETASQKRKREAEEEERIAKEAEERLEAEERARAAKRPRHHELTLQLLVGDQDAEDSSTLTEALKLITKDELPRRAASIDAFDYSEDESKEEEAVKELRSKLQGLKVVARAKVTEDRVYSAAYHPEPSKDLIFFGDKHGQLGIWDARARPDEVADEDGEVELANRESGKYWRLQLHWPATSKSSISCLKFNPVNSHSIYSTSYDCTIRQLAFDSGISTEIFSTGDTLISSIDLTPSGTEMWISDALGGATHLDLREDKSKAQWYGLSDQKIGSLSLNPTRPNFMVTASNNRALRIWDLRMLKRIAGELQDDAPMTPPPSSPGGPEAESVPAVEFGAETVLNYTSSRKGNGCLRGEWRHDKSVSSAYWDPRGRGIVSTSYDDTLRLWDINPSSFDNAAPFPSSRPFSRIRHNCQTGRWLTILRAQWSTNPEVYPHFTIGNMDHSLDIFTCKGDLITRLSDPTKITAVQAVTCSHPSVLERAVSGNGSGRCVLWAPPAISD